MTIIIVLLFSLCFISCTGISHSISINPQHSFYEKSTTYIDTIDDSSSWKFSTPEQQGINKNLLNQGIEKLKESPSLLSFLLLRNGYLVNEYYFNGSLRSHSNNVHSASKSILSALTGIAIKQEYISSEEQKLFNFFPDYFHESDSSKKKDISLNHLLTMTSGIYWRENYIEYKIDNYTNWIKNIIDLRLVSIPGRRFKYSTGSSHLMSAVITKATGISLLEYGNKNLFEPLGITVEHWGKDPQDNNSGGFNFYITARELAKFGQLYLNKGRLDSIQIITEQWVNKSTSIQKNVNRIYDYGYYWWLLSLGGHNVYTAWGYRGQHIFIIPDLSIVAVFTSNTKGRLEIIDAKAFICEYVLPAIRNQ